MNRLIPPAARRNEHTRVLHDITRADDYAWLADTDSPEVVAHLTAERAFYEQETAPLRELRDVLAGEMTGRVPTTHTSVPWDLARHSYVEHTPVDAEYPILSRFARGASFDPATAEVLLDPNDETEGSAYLAVGVSLVSPDERTLAYSLDRHGDEVYELRFRDLASGKDLPERAPRTYYGGAWSADSRFFFYLVHDAAYRPCDLWRHEIGRPVDEDERVLTEPDEQYELTARATRSGDLVVVRSANRDTSEVWLIDAHDPVSPPRCVETRRRGVEYDCEHRIGDGRGTLLVVTNDGAPEFRLMSTPVATPGREHWTELVAEDEGSRLYRVDAFASHLVLTVRREGTACLQVLDAAEPGRARLLAPSVAAGVLELAPSTRYEATSISVCEQSYVEPPRWFAVDLVTDDRLLVKHDAAPTYDPGAYAVERTAFTGEDGVPVPATVVRATGTPLDGTAPALIYGYGAYEATDDPWFDPALASLLDRGVVFVHAHVRGGGEGGRRWWTDGRLQLKQNTFTDLVTVADGLADGVVDPGRIATRGLSAGGLLQGAVFSQRPDRWRAVVAEVPFVDVVTTMLDDSIPLTANEWDEWGDPRRPEDFAWMLAYSPYDNLPPAGHRPDLLVTGALHDPRVMVREPAKWVAALRASDPAWSPRCLFRCEVDEGAHSGPSGRFARLRYEAEVYAWVLARIAPQT